MKTNTDTFKDIDNGVEYGGAASLQKVQDVELDHLTFFDHPVMVSEPRALDTLLGRVFKWSVKPLKKRW